MIFIIAFFSSIFPYLIAIVMFLMLILVHELGHFVAAKAVKVRVNEFSVGFGPTILRKKWGDTTYMLKLIPFGGYCAMEGEDEDSADENAFCNKVAWKRGLVVVVGAVFNLILGLIIVGIMLLPQDRFTSTTVAEFAEKAVSVESGLKEGDKIVKVDGRRVFTTYDLSYTFTGVKDGKLDLTVVRDGKKVELPDVKFATKEAEGISYIAVDFYVEGVDKTFGTFIAETAKMTLSYGRVVWFSLIDLITGKYGISAVSGPVGLTAAIGSVAEESLVNILPIMALITVNLGIFNLLPLPALDGGRLLFILFEIIFRKAVPQKYEGFVHAIGFVILILIMIAITAKDIWSLVV